MRLAEYSVRKKKPSEGDGEGGMTGEPFFCPLSEGAKQALRDFPFGKVIFYTDGASFGRLGDAVRSPRAAAVVQDAADALPRKGGFVVSTHSASPPSILWSSTSPSAI